MNTSEWIEAGAEVLASDGVPGLGLEIAELLEQYGTKAVLEALHDATSAAADHLGSEAPKGIDEVRTHLALAIDWCEEVAS